MVRGKIYWAGWLDFKVLWIWFKTFYDFRIFSIAASKFSPWKFQTYIAAEMQNLKIRFFWWLVRMNFPIPKTNASRNQCVRQSSSLSVFNCLTFKFFIDNLLTNLYDVYHFAQKVLVKHQSMRIWMMQTKESNYVALQSLKIIDIL